MKMYSVLDEPREEIDFGRWELVDFDPHETVEQVFPVPFERLGTVLHVWTRGLGSQDRNDHGEEIDHEEVIEHWCITLADGREFDGYYYRYATDECLNGLMYHRLRDAISESDGKVLSSVLPDLVAAGLVLPGDFFPRSGSVSKGPSTRTP